MRIATHGLFKDFVLEAGVEYFEIGGDPAELMSYMAGRSIQGAATLLTRVLIKVKNPGLIPGFESLTNGDIPKKRKMIGEVRFQVMIVNMLSDDLLNV